MPYLKRTRDQHFQDSGPKRILSLDGGGLRGVLSLSFLARVEELLRERHGGEASFRLCHYFDLIVGTSTGAIIAAALAQGRTVAEIQEMYQRLGREVFQRRLFGDGILRARYDAARLSHLLKGFLGEHVTLGDPALLTGLLVMTKRLDTGSPWPLGNNPRGEFFRAPDGATWISNADYPLWQVVRASTAAPSYFEPEKLTIASAPSGQKVEGQFVDGGVSPFNNPALQALMYATLRGYRVDWASGADRLLLVSVGTGHSESGQPQTSVAGAAAVRALLSLMDDCSSLVETLMQWISAGSKVRDIDLEIGDLRHDLLTPTALLSYVRYNLGLESSEVAKLKPGLPASRVASLKEMDETGNLGLWQELGELAAERQVDASDFPPGFDLPPVAESP